MGNKFDTEIVSDNPAWIRLASQLIKSGEVVGIPTETVYGLGADALNENAVEKIFLAKGRPSDNPLIVHVANMGEVDRLVLNISETGQKLMEAFWPGALTLVFKKSSIVPDIVCGGLDTVAIRMPAHDVARRIIETAQTPIAAPSANISGSPSPTSASHVYDDLKGRIPLIIDGGPCDVGVESTVVDVSGEVPVVLRPGAVTPAMIVDVVGETLVDNAVLSELEDGAGAASPGMKYRHYSPAAEVVLVETDSVSKFASFINAKARRGRGIIAICFSGEEGELDVPFLVLGERNNPVALAQNVFEVLRKADSMQGETIYCHSPTPEGVGLAVFNRLLRAAEFNVVKLD